MLDHGKIWTRSERINTSWGEVYLADSLFLFGEDDYAIFVCWLDNTWMITVAGSGVRVEVVSDEHQQLEVTFRCDRPMPVQHCYNPM